jgi:hypothetical protein
LCVSGVDQFRYGLATMRRTRTAHFHRLENLLVRAGSDFDFGLCANATAIECVFDCREFD